MGAHSRHSWMLRGLLVLVVIVAGALAGALVIPGTAATGTPPSVNVGASQVVTLGDTAFLPGSISDDGLPAPSELSASWSQLGGPATVRFGHADEAHTTATFSATGTYTLRLTASDGGGQGSADLTVTVVNGPATTIRVPADYPTIQAALDAAPAHSLVLVSPGTYQETIYVPRTLTLASTYYTTGDPARIDQTVIKGLDASLENVNISSTAGADTRFVGFTVTGGKDGVKVHGKAVVEHNRLTGLGTDAVEVTSGAAGLIQHNVMTQDGDDGVDLGGCSAVILDNTVQGNDGDGVETRTRNKTAPVDEVIIRGNRFLSNSDNGLQVIDDDAIASTPAQSATLFTIDRNIIARNMLAGLGLMDNGETSEDFRGASLVERITVTNNTFDGNAYGITGGDNLVAVNNIFAHHPQIALKNVDGASRAAYNLFYANGTRDLSSNLDTATSYTGDPLLDNTWTPQPGSPAIDRGTTGYLLPTGEEAVHVTDYQGTAPDLGAIETTGSGGGPTNTAPQVDAGPDQATTLPDGITLHGTATDDGLPTGSTLTTGWSMLDGPGTVAFTDPAALDTTATFTTPGTYHLQLSASDGQLTATDTLTATVAPAQGDGGQTTTIEARPGVRSDDAEEKASGSVSLTSTDLELVTDGTSVQTVGIRFPALAIPRGATITSAWIQFQTDEVTATATSLTLAAQAADDAATFTTAKQNVSSRARTAGVTWTPAAWLVKGERGAAQRTPDLSVPLQAVVSRSGWATGHAVAFVITGTGTRTAVAFDKSATAAPMLHVEYRP